MTDLLEQLETAAGHVADGVGASTVSIGRSSRGSGLVVSDGRVLTNAHNLRDRTTQVGFVDGRHAQGTVIGADRGSDLAVVEVDTADVAEIEWAADSREDGDAGTVGVGAAVFAAARGRGGSRLTVGFVSSLGRSFRTRGGRSIDGAIEHTAAMGRGSSGGPLVDSNGRVIGLNTHRIGEGFYLAQAADVELVARIRSLCDGIEPRRLELGIAVAPTDVAARLRRSVGLEERPGLLVRGIVEDSPAARADLRVGDLVVECGPVAITSVDDLHRELGRHDASEPLGLAIVRGAEEMTLSVGFDPPSSAG